MKKTSNSDKFLGSLEKFAPNNKPAEESESAKKKKTKIYIKKNKSVKIITAAALLGIILGLSATSYYFYHKYKTVPSVETDDTVAKVRKIMDLPTDETPTMATVTDKEKIKDQIFFAKAENGDRALIYPKAKKAILYRPSTNKIIEVMTLSVSNQDNSMPQQTQPEQSDVIDSSSINDQQESSIQAVAEPLKVAIYNGSKIKGLAAALESKIAGIEGVVVTEKKNAVGNYDKNIIVDLSGSHNESAQKIAEAIGGEVGSLPEGETASGVDILILGGTQ
jgi:hypothetical protein